MRPIYYETKTMQVFELAGVARPGPTQPASLVLLLGATVLKDQEGGQSVALAEKRQHRFVISATKTPTRKLTISKWRIQCNFTLLLAPRVMFSNVLYEL